MRTRLDKDKIKESLTNDDIKIILDDLGSNEPNRDNKENLIFSTVCHHGDSHKLYYYHDTRQFHCYTNCGSMDIYELIMKSKEEQGYTYTFPDALKYVADITGKKIFSNNEQQNNGKISDWQWLSKFRKKPKMTNELPTYDEAVLDIFMPYLNNWVDEGITYEIAKKYEIGYYFKKEQIVIPNRSEDGRLIGIRSRNTDIEFVENGVKYVPTVVENTIYSFPSMFNLFGLNHTKHAIQRMKKVLFFEGEKSVLKAENYFKDDNFTVAVLGNNISNWQRDKVLSYGVEEVFIAFDKFRAQKEHESDEIYKQQLLDYQKKLVRLAHKFTSYAKTYIIYDSNDLLENKDSPIDASLDIFLELMRNKIEITTKGEEMFEV